MLDYIQSHLVLVASIAVALFEVVGIASAANRSFRLNFEITMVVADRTFASEVERMLEADFARARLATAEDYHRRGLIFKLGVKVARLFSPIL